MGKQSSRKREQRELSATAGLTPPPGHVYEQIIDGDRSARVRGSDRKSNVIRKCELCGSVKQLLLGHVAPRWAALWTKSEGYILGSYRSLDLETKTQDYPKHYFFCGNCEQHLGVAENYLSRITRGTSDDLAKAGVSVSLRSDQPELSGITSAILLRALAGVMLKVHLSPHQLYKKWSLSRSEMQTLRRAILNDEYPESRFTFYAEKITNRVIPDANPRAALFLYFIRKHGGTVAKLTMAGMTWSLFLGPTHRIREEFDDAAMPLLFINGRPLQIVPSEMAADPTLMYGAPVPWDSLRPTTAIAPKDPCPCGLSLAFEDCCSGRWLPAHATYLDHKIGV